MSPRLPATASVAFARIGVCLLGGLLILAAGWASLLFLGVSATCSDDGDSSGCVGAVLAVTIPIAVVLPTAMAAIVVVCRTRQPAVAWRRGLGLLAAGVLTTMLLSQRRALTS
ncbi:hypothetical protein [Amycolatopsis jiangsuensis]|uniref:Transmembrane protein n=1 Tax=Amycolatopsis jiangsuensis TaxID=1181879 RepID=A0A840J2U2_9PSEU|nr:hypothetical protein [Amycolatopsis jiangsuensis]MBB4687945.1 hypothetical protein [Amycolatopsis jiangsuensis]